MMLNLTMPMSMTTVTATVAAQYDDVGSAWPTSLSYKVAVVGAVDDYDDDETTADGHVKQCYLGQGEDCLPYSNSCRTSTADGCTAVW